MNTSKVVQVAATGDVTTRDSYLRAVTLTAAADAASLTVRAGGSGGTVVLTVKAAIGATAVVDDLHDGACESGIHVTLTGTDPVATLVYV